ncbi:MAG: glycosyltransferase [Anaerolineae bacterium]|nr:glycosyltransferase [Anaerolineae bacterium]
MNRYALLIAYAFPPAGGPGVQRMLKFAKYLPEFDWQPVILTAAAESYLVYDATLMRDVADTTPIYRVANPDVNRLRPAANRRGLGRVLSALNVALMLPDANLFWARKARATAQEIIGKYQPKVMLSSCPPASAHMLALWIHQHFAIPWIADFRDPWSENVQTPYYPGYRTLNRRMEKRVLDHCQHVTTVSPPLVEMFQRLCGRAPHVTLIENGYDESDVALLPPSQTERFTILYTGTFSRLRRPDTFVEAITQLVANHQIPIESLRVAMAGKNIADYIPDSPPFENLGYLSHTALNALRQDSDVLLLILDDSLASRGNYSAKLFEYLACNRPTLCITHPENVAAQLITRAKAGQVVNPNPDEIAQVILTYYHAWKSRAFSHAPDWDVIHQFTRRSLTQRLVHTFERVIDETANTPFH